MDNENAHRVNGVFAALNRLPHDQTAVGFKLMHDPTKCTRCIAYVCVLQMDHLIAYLTPRDKSDDDPTAVTKSLVD
jgi:hypothetical protein